MKVPTKADRNQCYAARDEYFACLDKHSLWLDGLKPDTYADILAIDPTKPPILLKSDKSLTKIQKETLFTCSKAKELFLNSCLHSWFEHFSMLRVNKLQKDEMFEKLKEKDELLVTKGKEFWEEAQRKKA